MVLSRRAFLTAVRPILHRGRCETRNELRQQLRRLTLHEFQGQEILRGHGLSVPRGQVAKSPSEAGQIVQSLGTTCTLRPQVLNHAPHLGEVAGAARSADPSVAEAVAAEIFGVSEKEKNQFPAHFVYIEEVVDYDRQWDLLIGIDQEKCCPKVTIRRNPEAVGEEGEERVFELALSKGIHSSVAADISSFVGAPANSRDQLAQALAKLYQVFVERDAVQLRVKLLYSAGSNKIQCSSAFLAIDDAASKRQPKLFFMRDTKSEVPEELEAEAAGLVYVKMDGTVGNVVNGAGLAMATNDTIAASGGTSANFLDTGGQATEATMQKAFGIILRDPRVKSILVNIYGGIIRCDMIASSIISTAATLGPMRVPIVVRLQGTNSEEGLALLRKADLGLHVESDFGQAAAKAVELSQQP